MENKKSETKMKSIYFILISILMLLSSTEKVVAQTDSWQTLKNETSQLGKKEWQPMLKYVADLHERSTHPATYPFDYEWEEIGPGYVYGPAFGHWDVVHQIIDVLPSYPTHALHQLYKTGTIRISEINEKELKIGTKTIAIIGATIIDGNGSQPLQNATVIIKNNVIHSVGKVENISIPKDAEIIEAKGLTLLPGFIDPHFHYDFVKELPTKFLRNGVTSVRDPGEWVESYQEERDSGLPLPRLFLTGPHIEMPPAAYPEDAYIVRDKKEARTAVNVLADSGVSAIKIYFRLSLGLIEEVCAVARERGLPVTAHLEITDAREAILAGLDGIEHVTSFRTALLPPLEAQKYRQEVMKDNKARTKGLYKMWNELDINSPTVDSLIRFLAKHKTFVTPTLAAFEYRIDENKKDSVKLNGFKKMMAFIGKAFKGGVEIVVGSHGAWVGYAERGWSFQREMELLVESGMSPMDVIVSATIKGARFLRIQDRLGSIEKGKQADIVLVEGDPLKDIKALYNIKWVILNGVWIR
ncbi:MAG: amidohydrolase family protein [Melioribacteraceae bacterium]|nr:amidohydrolase family protein [Melioribacteraceae bacterium]